MGANIDERTDETVVHHRRHGDQHLAVEIASAADSSRCAARRLHIGKVSPSIRNCKRTAVQKVHGQNVTRALFDVVYSTRDITLEAPGKRGRELVQPTLRVVTIMSVARV